MNCLYIPNEKVAEGLMETEKERPLVSPFSKEGKYCMCQKSTIALKGETVHAI